jgi:glycosyltransferase involved in cell wall biosynthesis
MSLVTDVIVPAYDEAANLPSVLSAIPEGVVRQVYVVDNGSTDDTARLAAAHGAIVLFESRRGYGAACMRAVSHVAVSPQPPEALVFLQADGADDPGEIEALLRPIERQGLDLVLGSHALGAVEPGAVRLGDRVSRGVAVTLIRALYGQRYTGIGAFRAIRLPALMALGMRELGPGWNLEMQVKAVKAGLRVAEVPVRLRRRSAGPVREHPLTEVARVSSNMLFTILRHATSR